MGVVLSNDARDCRERRFVYAERVDETSEEGVRGGAEKEKRRRLGRRFGGSNETKIRNGNRGKRTHSKRRERGGFEVRSASFGGGNSLGERIGRNALENPRSFNRLFSGRRKLDADENVGEIDRRSTL